MLSHIKADCHNRMTKYFYLKREQRKIIKSRKKNIGRILMSENMGFWLLISSPIVVQQYAS